MIRQMCINLLKIKNGVSVNDNTPRAYLLGISQANEYTYDKNGNMTKDLNKNISSIQYNLLNLPQNITYGSGKSATYIYDAEGKKLRTSYKVSPSATAVPTDYCGNMVYENNVLKQILVDGGYITFSGSTPQYHYYLKDHLGNNRVVCSASGTVEQVNHYYPFGGLFGESTNGDAQRFKYNDKEFDRMHGLDWYDYGARHMSADIGRFTTIDPLAEKYYNISPYTYCVNNPLRYIDPDGKDGMITGQGTREDPYIVTAVYYYKNGELDDNQISGLNAAVSDYNKLGGSDGLVMKIDGVKSYVKFNLSVQGVDDLETARSGTSFETIGGDTRYYGNFVKTTPNTGEEYGSANNIGINFNVSNINNGIKNGMDKQALNKGVATHEIGHNLGGEHSDNTSTMSTINTIINTDLSGRSQAYTTYPKVSKEFAKIIIRRHDTQKRDRSDGRLWMKK